MKKPILIILLSLCSSLSYADHLFGAYLSITPINPATGLYRVRLQLYFDMTEINKNLDREPAATNPNSGIFFNILRKRDNFNYGGTPMRFQRKRDLVYDNVACAERYKFNTREYIYEDSVTLGADKYSDPGGYYMALDVCCRNADSNIMNAVKSPLILNCDIPPLWENGKPTPYASPQFTALNGDYICFNKNFTFDFGVTSPDPYSDELRYSLVTPLLGKAIAYDAVVVPSSTYPPVKWVAGISVQNMIPGSPALTINPKTGQLSVKANQIGIFAFAVLIEQYRNGVFRGSSRHEYQLPVVDCSGKTPPVPVITYNGVAVKEIEICEGEKITLETLNSPDWAFQWQFNGDNLPNTQTNKIVVGSAGDYTVIKSLNSICTSDTISSPVKVKFDNQLAPVKIIAAATRFCVGDSLLLKATSADSATYQWSIKGMNLAKSNNIYVKQTGLYKVVSSRISKNCLGAKDSINVAQYALTVLPPAKDTSICEGDSALIGLVSQANWKYSWLKDELDYTKNKSKITVSEAGNYSIKVTDGNGCKVNSGVYRISLRASGCSFKGQYLYIPDVFTPNNDGMNDVFVIQNIAAYPTCEVTIYNRWGTAIFYSKGYAKPWDGSNDDSPAPSGAYSYIIATPSHIYRGMVLVVR